MENQFTVEETEKQTDSFFTVILSCHSFSLAGNFDTNKKKLVGTWATSPTKYKTKENKEKAEEFLSSQSL